MYRILSPKALFLAFGWLVIGLLFVGNAFSEWFSLEIKSSSIPALAWIALNTLLFNPIWRSLWRRYPVLNKWVYPDLNGIWDVELCSNWPRQLQMLEAAAGRTPSIDMRACPESDLALLPPVKLRAEISQTWWGLEMRMWNPNGNTPIKDSDTISMDPFGRQGLRPPGICYFYKQQNQTANLADDTEFPGAARLEYDFATGRLTGLTWTARMWGRAMNTAGPIVFTRVKANA